MLERLVNRCSHFLLSGASRLMTGDWLVIDGDTLLVS